MATTNAALQPPTADNLQSDIEQDEAATNVALVRLHELHINLRSLRQTLPNLMESLVPPSTPEQLYANFSDGANKADRSVRNFVSLVRDEKTRQTLEHVNQSRENDGQEIEAWKWEDHPDWLDAGKEFGRYREESAEAKKTASQEKEGMEEEDLGALVERIGKERDGMQVSFDDQKKVVKLALGALANMTFELQISDATPDREWEVVADTKNKLLASIAKAVNETSKEKGLQQMLDLLTAYQDVKTRPCDKCSRLMDKSGQLPVVRLPSTSQPEKWQALHQSCL